MYTFETEFDLAAYDLSTVTLVAQVMADNGVTAVRINGQPVKFKPWVESVRTVYNKFHNIEINGDFVQGINKIQFDVWNGINGYYPESKNPMAMRVEWQAFGRPRSGPGFARFQFATGEHLVSDGLSSLLMPRGRLRSEQSGAAPCFN
jgi:hypothetical protein